MSNEAKILISVGIASALSGIIAHILARKKYLAEAILAEAQATATHAETSHAVIAMLREQLDRFKVQMDEQQREFRARVADMDKEINQLKVENRELKTSIKNLASERIEYKRSKEKYERIQRGQSNIIADLEQSNKKLRARCTSLEGQILHIKNKYAEIEAETKQEPKGPK